MGAFWLSLLDHKVKVAQAAFVLLIIVAVVSVILVSPQRQPGHLGLSPAASAWAAEPGYLFTQDLGDLDIEEAKWLSTQVEDIVGGVLAGHSKTPAKLDSELTEKEGGYSYRLALPGVRGEAAEEVRKKLLELFSERLKDNRALASGGFEDALFLLESESGRGGWTPMKDAPDAGLLNERLKEMIENSERLDDLYIDLEQVGNNVAFKFKSNGEIVGPVTAYDGREIMELREGEEGEPMARAGSGGNYRLAESFLDPEGSYGGTWTSEMTYNEHVSDDGKSSSTSMTYTESSSTHGSSSSHSSQKSHSSSSSSSSSAGGGGGGSGNAGGGGDAGGGGTGNAGGDGGGGGNAGGGADPEGYGGNATSSDFLGGGYTGDAGLREGYSGTGAEAEGYNGPTSGFLSGGYTGDAGLREWYAGTGADPEGYSGNATSSDFLGGGYTGDAGLRERYTTSGGEKPISSPAFEHPFAGFDESLLDGFPEHVKAQILESLRNGGGATGGGGGGGCGGGGGGACGPGFGNGFSKFFSGPNNSFENRSEFHDEWREGSSDSGPGWSRSTGSGGGRGGGTASGGGSDSGSGTYDSSKSGYSGGSDSSEAYDSSSSADGQADRMIDRQFMGSAGWLPGIDDAYAEHRRILKEYIAANYDTANVGYSTRSNGDALDVEITAGDTTESFSIKPDASGRLVIVR